MKIRIRKHILLWSISAALILGALTLALAGGRLFVVNTLSENLSIIDIAADKSLGSIPLGAHGYRVAFSPDGSMAYVTASSDVTSASQAKTKDAALPSRLLFVDLAKNRLAGELPLDIAPLANIHVHPNGRESFVVTAGPPGSRNLERGRVLFVDLPRRKVTRTVDIGLNPLDSVMTPDGKLLFTADWGSRSISVVDLAAGRLIDTLPLGMAAARALAMRPDGKHIYLALETPFIAFNNNMQAANVFTQQTANFNYAPAGGTEVAHIDVLTRKLTRFPVDGVGSVIATAVTPDGSRLYLYGTVTAPALERAGRAQADQRQQPQQQAAPAYVLFAVDLAKKQVAQRLGSHGYLSALAVSPDGKKLYLIGAPGDPKKEADVQQRVSARVRGMNETNMAKAGPAPPSANEAGRETVSGILDDLSRLPKTLIVLDAATGRPLKTLPLGSLPNGYGVVEK
jgi:DNA-binding beta-propeller fold protein YncE